MKLKELLNVIDEDQDFKIWSLDGLFIYQTIGDKNDASNEKLIEEYGELYVHYIKATEGTAEYPEPVIVIWVADEIY